MNALNTARFDKLIWVLVFAGMILFGLGLSVQRSDSSLGFGISVVGGLTGAIGVILIYVRSRFRDPD